MCKLTDYIDPLAFFIAFSIGLLFVYIFSKPKKIIIQWPTPENINDNIYRHEKDNKTCYKYKAEEVGCDSSAIKTPNN